MDPTAGTKLSDLSDPVILHILRNLTAVDLCAVAGTSRRMRRIAKDKILWRNVVIELSTATVGSDGGRSIISRIVDGYLGDITSSLEIRPCGGKRHLHVVSVHDASPWMRVLKDPPISLFDRILVTIGRKCKNLEELRLVDCELRELGEVREEMAHLASLKSLVFQWCASEAWEYWILSLTILAPALRTLSLLDCFDSTFHDGHSIQMALDIDGFKCLEELTISENRTLGTASFALIYWHSSFHRASESLKKLSINSCRLPRDWLQWEIYPFPFPNLQVLNARGSVLTTSLVELLNRNVPNLEILR